MESIGLLKPETECAGDVTRCVLLRGYCRVIALAGLNSAPTHANRFGERIISRTTYDGNSVKRWNVDRVYWREAGLAEENSKAPTFRKKKNRQGWAPDQSYNFSLRAPEPFPSGSRADLSPKLQLPRNTVKRHSLRQGGHRFAYANAKSGRFQFKISVNNSRIIILQQPNQGFQMRRESREYRYTVEPGPATEETMKRTLLFLLAFWTFALLPAPTVRAQNEGRSANSTAAENFCTQFEVITNAAPL